MNVLRGDHYLDLGLTADRRLADELVSFSGQLRPVFDVDDLEPSTTDGRGALRGRCGSAPKETRGTLCWQQHHQILLVVEDRESLVTGEKRATGDSNVRVWIAE